MESEVSTDWGATQSRHWLEANRREHRAHTTGGESFVYHSHQSEEEWLYILSGRSIAEIDSEEIDVAAGTFMAFPTPSVPHHLKHPFDQDLVYLMGGENRENGDR